MSRPSPTLLTLLGCWTFAAVAFAWTTYRDTPALSRDLLLILGAYGAIVVAMIGGIVLRARCAPTPKAHGN